MFSTDSQSSMKSDRGRNGLRNRRSSTRYARLDRFTPQVDRMSQLQLSIIEGSPYYEEKRERKVADESVDEGEVESVPARKGTHKYHEFGNEVARRMLTAFHLCSQSLAHSTRSNSRTYTAGYLVSLCTSLKAVPIPLVNISTTRSHSPNTRWTNFVCSSAPSHVLSHCPAVLSSSTRAPSATSVLL
ncbi:hypothetical protein QFC21_000124 [Naganishia friedmannii]|uniref:Uncharacterized protein n=1 Tax=Naganishia friedmannii TaxID=89922 RepID=A0ACC2WAM9_9TREE|nr:hypothetical protein QFC21_000124 [Naganishia friedmannii]